MLGGEVIFTASTAVFRSPAETLSTSRYAADPSKRPATIDLWADQELTLGIYQLKGEKLELHLGARGEQRPEELDAK